MSDLKITISRSYDRKIDPALYGGNRFEIESFFSSRSVEMPIESTASDLTARSLELYEDCVLDVEQAVQERIGALQKEKAKKDQEEKLAKQAERLKPPF